MFSKKLKLAATLSLPLVGAACGTTDRIKSTSIALDDYHARHPILIAEAKTSIDVFPSGGQSRLDSHTAKQVYAFAAQYRDVGQGAVSILVPRGRGFGYRDAVLADIRKVLVAGGVRSGVDVSTYPVADPGLASPIRLSFVGVKAKVGDQCGQWPNDLASGSSVEGWENKTYWNFGCATQSVIAAQTSDPRDLVSPRGEEPPDTLIRQRGIETIRKGVDPSVAWKVRSSSIVGVGGN